MREGDRKKEREREKEREGERERERDLIMIVRNTDNSLLFILFEEP